MHGNNNTLPFSLVVIGRDHEKKKGIEEASFKVEGKDDVEKVLQRYDIQRAIYVRGYVSCFAIYLSVQALKKLVSLFIFCYRPPSNPSCNNQTRNGTMSPFWKWTINAVLEGDKTIRERVYDMWSYAVSPIEHKLVLLI